MNEPNDEIDLAKRWLCPDGNCLGVLDAEGQCPTCGKRDEDSDATAPQEPGNDATEQGQPAEAILETAATSSIGDHDADEAWQERALCSDGNCIGVLSADGVCRECGKRTATG